MEHLTRKIALVTGASSGIGAAIAERLAKQGMTVIGLARRTEPILELSKQLSQLSNSKIGELYAISCDLTKEEEICNAFKWTTANVGPLDVLINNAGCNPGAGTDILNGNAANWQRCFEVNVIGLATAAREAVKIMAHAQISGHIVNINSDLGHIHLHVPTMSLYSASKHAVTNISELLRAELNASKMKHNTQYEIRVTNISPGYVESDFLNAETRRVLQDDIKDVCFLKAGDVADAVVYALSTSQRVHVSEITLVNTHL